MPEHEFMSKKATVVDFGLTPEQEERAKELHEKIIGFDSLMECSWYDDFIKLCKEGGGTAGDSA